MMIAKTRITLSDDHPIMLAGLRNLIEAEPDLELVGEATNGAAALKLIRDQKPDVAILDISMPEMNGMDVCRAVRADPGIGDVRILLLSASVDEAAVNLGIESGADYFMAKPFSPREMVEWLAVGKEAR